MTSPTFDFTSITQVSLSAGSHPSPSDGLCFMEMVAWFEGEEHSDKPRCVCPVLGAYGIRLNDDMPHDLRDRLLKPLVPLMAGTRDEDSEQKRAEFLAMWTVNKILPVALRKCGLDADALTCENAATLDEANASASAARAAAWAVRDARAAAWAASGCAASAASASAARAAARAAAWAARDAALVASGCAASAARAAASVAAHAQTWPLALEGLRQAILIGRHAGFSAPELLALRYGQLRETVSA